ncbi:hypothetical protein JZ751_027463 [Albula glossodonta]|uniref:Fucolectin tachylectin-4 pentraxin-1 domain-containing protein n=1 Tax=Albula glossodonta TaxID=121402 RepID=A0A8T2MR57_9TELE|nr:hypothetical protein JZ751_027463 [Albula glossodonta]
MYYGYNPDDLGISSCLSGLSGGCGAKINAALRGRATQSSILVKWKSSAALSQADHAIDGNKNSNWFHGSCSSTAFQKNPWWRVDLLENRTIHSVTITPASNKILRSQIPNKAEIRIGNSRANNGNSNQLNPHLNEMPVLSQTAGKNMAQTCSSSTRPIATRSERLRKNS